MTLTNEGNVTFAGEVTTNGGSSVCGHIYKQLTKTIDSDNRITIPYTDIPAGKHLFLQGVITNSKNVYNFAYYAETSSGYQFNVKQNGSGALSSGVSITFDVLAV